MFKTDDRKAADAIIAALLCVKASGGNWWQISSFVLCLGLLTPGSAMDGEVAEWLKAAVC
jgi:hypothetical protein